MEIDPLRYKRPILSIVLNPGGKEMLSNDTEWCADRGIPFRRGYLFHGVTGSGKFSLIHTRACEPMFDIYSLPAIIVNLQRHAHCPRLPPPRALHHPSEDLDGAFARERLDPALSRPGPMYLWVEFRNTGKWQAEALFRNFFPSMEESATKNAEMEKDLRVHSSQLMD
ncbi:hypothetical protein FIBSPDRAFT_948400 [Athelia psychrophila]|uniref:Uncharacterized protein n=1 Tax=Athelia psychrophila TaxID=1759441 RepID=A0A166QRS2_9AGAM|nr:hypothetical protein FIBSPDRAFT_948400 [Fibularhizoctonia sp. CBS 109695]